MLSISKSSIFSKLCIPRTPEILRPQTPLVFLQRPQRDRNRDLDERDVLVCHAVSAEAVCVVVCEIHKLVGLDHRRILPAGSG